MHSWEIEKLYAERIAPKGSVGQDRHKINFINEKKYSKKEIATIISSKDENLEPGASSKDVRLQPLDNFDRGNFEEILKAADLEIIRIAEPGDEGSTSSQFDTYIVKDTEGNEYPIVLGKGKGTTLKAENRVIDNIKRQIETILLEIEKDFFYVDINGVKSKINGIETTKGVPKSDFSLTYNGSPAIFISHKDGSKPTDFQQYGGITCKSGKSICNHEEVEKFVSDMKEKFPDGVKSKQSYYRKINSKELKLMSMYGADYGEKFGEDNVHVLLQGKVELDNVGDDTYELKANHVMYNGEVPEEDSGYDPMFYLRFSGSRGGNFGLKDGRFMIVPKGKIQSTIKRAETLKQNIDALTRSEKEFSDLLSS